MDCRFKWPLRLAIEHIDDVKLNRIHDVCASRLFIRPLVAIDARRLAPSPCHQVPCWANGVNWLAERAGSGNLFKKITKLLTDVRHPASPWRAARRRGLKSY
jgi:hypothetical protein